ncbi:hypothetical protein EDB85DRAFT_1888811 [Lactarius pseudohatsudake]|nr:hypothetical protein EDB85DRAFT_1888811 [Lactarius pseudohatsudake]
MTSKSKSWEAAECHRMVPWFHDEVLFCGNKDEVKGWMYGKSAEGPELGRRSLSGRRGAGAGARARRRPIPASLTSNTERTEQPRVGALHDASYYDTHSRSLSPSWRGLRSCDHLRKKTATTTLAWMMT